MKGLYLGTALAHSATTGDVLLALVCGIALGALASLFI